MQSEQRLRARRATAVLPLATETGCAGAPAGIRRAAPASGRAALAALPLAVGLLVACAP